MQSPTIVDRTILLVEDSGIQAKAFVALLQRLGYSQVLACPNADIAYERLRSGKFDLIICDWQMPQKSGLDFLKELRGSGNAELENIPFFFLTANAEKELVIQALRAGAQDYIVKPPSDALLQDKLDSFFKVSRDETRSTIKSGNPQ